MEIKIRGNKESYQLHSKLNDSFEFRFPSFFQEITIVGVQPLFIISFINLFAVHGEMEIIIAFGLIILTLFHEFYLADAVSDKWLYQLIIIVIWVSSFLLISYRANISEQKNKSEKMSHQTDSIINKVK